jgi:hypothetical protein
VIARRQSARWWEVDATTALARLWHRQGATTKGIKLLEPIYAWFTEGFERPALISARALLDEVRLGG